MAGVVAYRCSSFALLARPSSLFTVHLSSSLRCNIPKIMSQTIAGFTSASLNAKGQPEITLERHGEDGRVVRLLINKPERLNALSLSMIRDMRQAVDVAFGRATRESTGGHESAAAKLLILKGAGGRAFCAGGDVRSIAEGKSSGPGVPGSIRADFFKEEYLLDYHLSCVARQAALLCLWDGVVMGGGVGISIHGTFRVATENTLFAMPETAIGLFPDVGTAYVLSRLPGGLGQYLGLTGGRLRGDDLLFCGLATHMVSSERLPELEDALAKDRGNAPAAVLEHFVSDTACPAESALAESKPWIDEAFGGARSVEQIVERLETLASDTYRQQAPNSAASQWARDTLDSLGKASPIALKVTHRHIAWAASATLEDTFRQDFRVMQHMMSTTDFEEGVRARLVDKDNSPAWSLSTLPEVSEAAVDALFAELGEHELHLPRT